MTETARSRQTASSVTYVEPEPQPSILQVLGSPKGAMKGYKDKLGDDFLDLSNDVGKSANTSEESLPIARVNRLDAYDGDVEPGEAV